MSQHKTEAERALEQIVERLKSAEPIEGLARFQLTATTEYALAEVRQIQELKRIRRAVPDSPATPGSDPAGAAS